MFPAGPHYVLALDTLQESYYEMGAYQSALDISKKMYVDGLNRMKLGLQTKKEKDRWTKTVAKIGQCYYKLGNIDKAEQLMRSYSREFLQQPYVGEVYTDWSGIALGREQVKEATRRLDVAIPRVKDVEQRTKMRVARNLLKLKRIKEIDYLRAVSLLTRIGESKMLRPELKKELQQELGEALLEYNYNNRPESFIAFLDKMLLDFKDEPWLEYWLMKSLTPLFGTLELHNLAKKLRVTLDRDFTDKSKNILAYQFLKKQLDIINSLSAIDVKYDKLATRQNGALYK